MHTVKALSAYALILLLVGLLGGCATSGSPGVGISPETLGRISARIEQHPERKNQILLRHDLTPAEYEKAVRDVSSNPDLSARYTRAYRRELDGD